MNLPEVITDLVKAQNNSDSMAYAACFSDKAVVFDEGKNHTGKIEIQQWITKANSEYQTQMEPLAYEEEGMKGILAAKISGTFEGSPLVLKYHFEMTDSLIQSLKITA